jgi:hypothetical protein
VRFAPKVQLQDNWYWENVIIISPVEHMHDTQLMGQRDVRQRKKAEGMTSQMANTDGLVDTFKVHSLHPPPFTQIPKRLSMIDF